MRVLVLAVMFGLILGCGGTQAPPVAIPEATQETVDPSTLGEWSGNGSLQTEAFTVEAQSWGIEWAFEDTLGLGLGVFGVCVQTLATRQGTCAHQPVGTHEDGAGTGFVHEAGTFYLGIDSTGDWTVRAFIPD